MLEENSDFDLVTEFAYCCASVGGAFAAKLGPMESFFFDVYVSFLYRRSPVSPLEPPGRMLFYVDMKLFLLELIADYACNDCRGLLSEWTFVIEDVPSPEADLRLTSLKAFWVISPTVFGELILRENSVWYA